MEARIGGTVPIGKGLTNEHRFKWGPFAHPSFQRVPTAIRVNSLQDSEMIIQSRMMGESWRKVFS